MGRLRRSHSSRLSSERKLENQQVLGTSSTVSSVRDMTISPPSPVSGGEVVGESAGRAGRAGRRMITSPASTQAAPSSLIGPKSSPKRSAESTPLMIGTKREKLVAAAAPLRAMAQFQSM